MVNLVFFNAYCRPEGCRPELFRSNRGAAIRELVEVAGNLRNATKRSANVPSHTNFQSGFSETRSNF